jgi:hypothetical protein
MDGVTFCGNCGARMESYISQTPETPRQDLPNDEMRNQPPSQQDRPQQPPYQQQPQQPYGGNSRTGGYAYTVPSGGPSNGGMVLPKNYMTESIVVTIISFLCCCSPISVILGIIAIVKANNVNSEFERRNMTEALSNADSAKKLTIWAAVISVVFYILYMIFYFVIWLSMIKESGGLENFLEDI